MLFVKAIKDGAWCLFVSNKQQETEKQAAMYTK